MSDDLENDLFDEGMIVSAADVVPHPDTVPPRITVVGANYEDADNGLDPWASLVAGLDGQEEPGQRAVVPPEQYDRVNAQVAPDGSPLSPNQIAKPHLWRAGDQAPNKRKGGKAANRINVRELVNKLASETMLDPIEVLFYIMNANEESRHHLGLRKSDRISPNLRAKCAQELMTYMAPKLKSVEMKVGDPDSKSTGVQIFLPKNEREQGAVAEQPELVLPEKDGVTVPFSPELAAQLIGLGDDESNDWDDGEE